MFIPVRKIAWILMFIVVTLIAIYTFNTLSIHFIPNGLPDYFTAHFDIDGESNIPTWYSTILLFSIALTAFLILRLQHTVGEAEPDQRIFWQVFMAVYLFFSLDEGAVLHEIIDQNTPIKWVYVYAPLFVIFFVYCAYYWLVKRKELLGPKFWILGGLLLFAIGGGFLEWVSHTFPLSYALGKIELVLEEGAEMMGAILVLTGCLMEFNRLFGKNINSQ